MLAAGACWSLAEGLASCNSGARLLQLAASSAWCVLLLGAALQMCVT
jgi:hypothetical protein